MSRHRLRRTATLALSTVAAVAGLTMAAPTASATTTATCTSVLQMNVWLFNPSNCSSLVGQGGPYVFTITKYIYAANPPYNPTTLGPGTVTCPNAPTNDQGLWAFYPCTAVSS